MCHTLQHHWAAANCKMYIHEYVLTYIYTYTHKYIYSYIHTFMCAYFTFTHIETYRNSCHITCVTHTVAPSSSCRPHTHNSTRAFRNRCSFFFCIHAQFQTQHVQQILRSQLATQSTTSWIYYDTEFCEILNCCSKMTKDRTSEIFFDRLDMLLLQLQQKQNIKKIHFFLLPSCCFSSRAAAKHPNFGFFTPMCFKTNYCIFHIFFLCGRLDVLLQLIATNCCVRSMRHGLLSGSGFRWRLYIYV